MGEPISGASSGPAGAMDPPTGALESPIDLAGASQTEDPNAKVTRNMNQQHVSSSPSSEEEKEKNGEEEDDQGAVAKERSTRRRVFDDMFNYRGYSWPEVVGLKAYKAKRIIRKGKPDIHFEVVSKNQLLTMCYVSRRVRLIVDRSNCVVRTPRVG